MKPSEKQQYLRRIFYLAVEAGICKTQGQFAQLLEVDRTTLSAAMNGREKNLTDSLVRRVRSWALENGIEETEAPQVPPVSSPSPSQGGVFIPAETVKFFENLTASNLELARLVSRLQRGEAGISRHALPQKLHN